MRPLFDKKLSAREQWTSMSRIPASTGKDGSSNITLKDTESRVGTGTTETDYESSVGEQKDAWEPSNR